MTGENSLSNYFVIPVWFWRLLNCGRRCVKDLSFTEYVYPSDANFLLAKMKNARNIYEQLCQKGIIVRDRSKVVLCEDSLRITVGTEDENKKLIEALNNL